eukprot:gene1161-1501_t
MVVADPDAVSSNHYHIELQALEDYRSFCAATIQRYYRGWICRHRLKQKSSEQLLQLQLDSDRARAAHHLYTAARTIQDAWRSYSNRRIYRFYRDLIIFREYVKPDGSLGQRSTRGWYRRDDRNGWRPVAERLLLDRQQQSALPPPAAAGGGGVDHQHRHKRRKPAVKLACSPRGSSWLAERAENGSSVQQDGRQREQQAHSTGQHEREVGSSSGHSSPVFYHYCPAVR